MDAAVCSVEVKPVLKEAEIMGYFNMTVLVEIHPTELFNPQFAVHYQNHIRKDIETHRHIEPVGPLIEVDIKSSFGRDDIAKFGL